jgi:Flp pilus assembly protein CpaB
MRASRSRGGAQHQCGSGREEGERVKRQTLILVVIGVVLFVAGGALAFSTIEKGSKQGDSPTAVAPVNTPVVVATVNIPAGTTGQNMVSQNMVAIQLIPQKQYAPTDLTTLQNLTDQVLTSSVAKGQAVRSTQIIASTSSISLPKGLDGVTVTMPGTNALAGYLQPGSRIDVYANITKLSIGSAVNSSQSALPLPCTELAMSNIEVLDVSQTVPTYSSHPSSTGRVAPSNVTLLLAVTPSQAEQITFLTLNETLSVAQTQSGASAPSLGQCIGTDQTTSVP